MNDGILMPYGVFFEKLKEYMQLYHAVEQVTCPQIILMKRDEIREELRESFCDLDDNIARWMKKKECTFVNPETHNRVKLFIDCNVETLYQFLLFCREINITGILGDEKVIFLI